MKIALKLEKNVYRKFKMAWDSGIISGIFAYIYTHINTYIIYINMHAYKCNPT